MACRRSDQRLLAWRWWSPIRRTAAAVTLALATFAAPAEASTLSKTGSTIVYNASSPEANVLTVSRLGTDYVFAESAVTIDELCEDGNSATNVRCGAAGVTEIRILLQDNGDHLTIDDSVAAAGQPRILAEGGDGPDELTGGAGPESLCGGPGVDTLNGGGGNDRLDFPCIDSQGDQTPGADTLNGDAGDDQLNGGPAGSPLEGDKLFGGDGTDTAYYDLRVAPLTITLDDVANDGEAGEGDNVHADVENVIGGSAGDTLAGSDAPNALDARDGDDIVTGGGADDTLAGGVGNDRLSGGDGADTLNAADGDDALMGDDGNDLASGGGGADALNGGPGGDMLAGGPGLDTLDGGDGDDRLNGAEVGLVGGDGNDTLRGGRGADVLLAGPGDDWLDGGLEGDQIYGEDGRDTLSYEDRARSVTVTLNGRADDGEDGERDNVASDVEVVVGGTLWDTLTGDRNPNTLRAGLGEDFVTGNAGIDTLDSGGGPDLIWARDGTQDTVDCGGGGDLAVVDKSDDVRDCRWRDQTGRRNPVFAQSALVKGSAYGYQLPDGLRAYSLGRGSSLKFPMGSTIDARQAAVRVTIATTTKPAARHAATTAATAKSASQDVSVSGGPFTVRQRAGKRPATVFRFRARRPRCSRDVNGPRVPADARAPRIMMRIDERKRRRGRPRTPQVVVAGEYSLGAAFGTVWTTEERCNGTFTRVRSGTVRVHDLERNRTRTLHAGDTYFARRR
jgi:Ca2+-binding RTX toxin-like protein